MSEETKYNGAEFGISDIGGETIIELSESVIPEKRRAFIQLLIWLYDLGYEEGTGQNMTDGDHNMIRIDKAADSILEYMYG